MATTLCSRSKNGYAADNDLHGKGIEAARKLLFRLPLKTILKVPARPGWDWNDVLLKGLMDKEWV